MHSLFKNKVSIPVKEEALANNGGVWHREVLPDFWLMDLPEGATKITGISYDLIQRNQLSDVVEKYLAREKGVDIYRLDPQLKKSLNLFSYEYSLLRQNGMDCLLRVAKKDKINFNFYNHIPEDKEDRYIACFIARKNQVAFHVPSYQYIGDENILAHELGHCLFFDDFAYSDKILNTITCSDFGLKWMSFNQMRASMIDSRKWATACKRYYETYHREHKSLSSLNHFISGTVYFIQNSSIYHRMDGDNQRRVQQEEMMCRLIGFAGLRCNGIKFFRKNEVDRSLLEIIVHMAEAYANGSEYLYNFIRDTVHHQKMSHKTTTDMMLFWQVNAQHPKQNCTLNHLRQVSFCLNRFEKELSQEARSLCQAIEYGFEQQWLHCIEQKKIKRMFRDSKKYQLKCAYSQKIDRVRE